MVCYKNNIKQKKKLRELLNMDCGYQINLQFKENIPVVQTLHSLPLKHVFYKPILNSLILFRKYHYNEFKRV